ncbi:MAG: hypothetical protein U0871_03270 [Gemmataceae bacterium]
MGQGLDALPVAVGQQAVQVAHFAGLACGKSAAWGGVLTQPGEDGRVEVGVYVFMPG